jgi:predicted DCC family thiol-disulfide oxidoreductase YuxK
MPSEERPMTVYYDGGCPLCQAEINHYRKQEGADKICFRDVSTSEQILAGDLTKQQAMARFHVRGHDGSLLSGAAAFAAVWGILPRWKWAARLAALPGVLMMLEIAYRLFLPVRPILSRLFGRVIRRDHRIGPAK